MKLKDLSRRLALKHAQIPATMVSPTNPDIPEVKIPKAPNIPVEFVEYKSDVVPRAEKVEPTSETEESIDPSAVPTPKNEEFSDMSMSKQALAMAINYMFHANVVSGTWKYRAIDKLRKGDENYEAQLQNELREMLDKAEKNALEYAKKMKKIKAFLTNI